MAPSNTLPIHGNEKTMNLNSLVLTNIQSSPYFKVHLYELKTYHQVIDEIYYKVNHLEPWEKGSRKTAGQTGMCGGVRGVGAGGIVSSAYCLLYKLYTLKLTRKQLIGLCTHADSPYIRALGLMYIRYTQPPGDLWEWYEPYLDDEEQVDVKAGGGNMMTIGEIAQQYLTKLEWYSTLFPRIPVPIQKQIEAHLSGHRAKNWNKVVPQQMEGEPAKPESRNEGDNMFGEAERVSRRETSRERRPVVPSRRPEPNDKDRLDQERSRPRDDRQSRPRDDRHSHGDVKRESYKRSRSPRGRRSNSRDRHHSRPDDHGHRRRSHDRLRHRSRDRSLGRSHRRSKDRKRSSSRSRRRSRSHDDRNAKRSDDNGRHSSKTVDGAKRLCSSRHRSASPKNHASSGGDAFDRDLQKELERVKAAKDTENGRK